jgi:penicillin amidase
MPGLPFVLTGRNTHVAWGITAMGADGQDLYIEHLRGSGDATEFELPDGRWAAVAHHHELVRVRGSHDVTLDVLTTEHPLGSKRLSTPIISGLYPHEGRALSLAWTAYDAASLPLPLEAVDTADSGQALVAAASTMGGPTLNLVYADDQKHIGYHAIGEIPVRGPAEKHPRNLPQLGMPGTVPPGDPNQTSEPESEPEAALRTPSFTLASYHAQRRSAPPARAQAKPKVVAKPGPIEPVEDVPPSQPVIDYTIGSPIPQVPADALNAAAQWSGVIPYDQLPQVIDPPSGVIVTANSRVTPDDYPYAVTEQWHDAFRTERLYHLLNGRTGLTPEDMLHNEMDVHSDFDFFLAERLAYAVDHASAAALKNDGKRLHAAADLLRNFKGDMRGDDAAPAITSAVRPELWNALLAPQIWKHDHMKQGDKAAYPISNLYTWITRTTVLETLLNHEPARWLPPGEKNWDDFLTSVLEVALQRAHAPSDVTRWKYGQMYPIELAHPLLTNTVIERLLGMQTGSGKRAGNGSPLTVDASYGHFGPSERFTADLSNPDATIANVTTGQSGNPASSHYLDQMEAWLTGKSFALPLQHPEAAHTLTLEP